VEQHIRTTYLFSVDDANTMTQVQSRSRIYNSTEDPTNPTGGVLGSLNTNQRVYTRFTASDADLLLP
jgi:hypothetical protein